MKSLSYHGGRIKFREGEKFPTTKKQREAARKHDTIAASVHEAGHIVAGLYAGAQCAHGRLFVRNEGNIFGIRSVGGQAFSHRKGKLKNAIIGYAGVVAEILADNPDSDLSDIRGSIEWGDIEPSGRDWDCIRMVHASWRNRALDRCVRLLKKHWRDVDVVATSLTKALNIEIALGIADEESAGRSFFTLEVIRILSEGATL